MFYLYVISLFNLFQRLEFLGDSVLDLLITSHLYQSHIDIDPGMLTDLRSASVNNENFARVAVRHGLYKHLLHSSTVLLSQMTEYARCLNEYNENNTLSQGQKGPKVRFHDDSIIHSMFDVIFFWVIA